MSTPILRDFPAAFESERLLLRAPCVGDGDATYQAVMESMAELRTWLPWANDSITEDTQEAVMRRAHADFMARTDLMLLIFLKSSGELLGGSGLHNIDWRVPRFEIGYWLRTSHTGKGLMTEATSTIAAFAFDTLGARRVEIRCDERNTRSAAVALRSGFALEGVLRNSGRDHLTGELVNEMVFAQIR